MCLVANCEASGKQDPVPAKTKQDDADIPTNLWCDLSKYSKWLSGYFNEKPFTLRARGPDGKQVLPSLHPSFFLHDISIAVAWPSDTQPLRLRYYYLDTQIYLTKSSIV